MRSLKNIFLLLLIITSTTVFAGGDDQQTYRVVAHRSGAAGVESVSNTSSVVVPANIYIPNAFTPNGDGMNDVWMPSLTGVEQFNIHIFNRWGEVIASGEEVLSGWDGNVNGVSSPNGVYVYKISGWNADRTKFYEYTGSINLIR